MFGRHKCETLVAGAGPVGLLTAVLLRERGVEVEVVDQETGTAGHSYAALLHPYSLHLLDDAGLVNDLIAKGVRVRTIGLFDRAGAHAQMSFDGLPAEFPFGLVVPQSELERVLERRIEELGLRVRWSHRLEAFEMNGQVTAHVSRLESDTLGYIVQRTGRVVAGEPTFDASFVVGADGHRSRVRRALGLEVETAGPQETYAVFEFEATGLPADEMRVVLGERTRDVLLPMPEGRYRFSFQLEGRELSLDDRRKSRDWYDRPESAFADPTAELAKLVHERAPWCEGRLGKLHWAALVPFGRRLASRYGQGRGWLAGDAAHLTGPVGVQSMNVGLSEAHELAWRLSGILRHHADSAQLAELDRRRRAEWRFLLGLEGGLESDGAETWVAGNAPRLLTCLPATGVELDHLVGQIGLKSRGNPSELH